ncbi:GT4 family glycosyltransferase PelF [Acidovorax sp. RAC01]|uniref:GT4 family glycosyltransferase PelF n=1 Tax=Acidovorax sp. RAC01 TaxID=1842533 RepID=UPI00083E91F8|nr:GT4 family glycosyltransferase PelF [Acidovorax sp. RAC01]AOG24326.1 glycosyl transferases group 1 family protein [Acidovorax sp. RAC01]
MSQHPKAEQADIALLLEGTFPYVSGGVSSWINQIIRAFPEYTYAIIFLGSQSRDYPKFKYELPANVVHFEQHFLYDHLSANDLPRAREGDPATFRILRDIIETLRQGTADTASALEMLRAVTHEMRPGGKFPLDDFLYSEQSWELICDTYRSYCTDPSFVDYFWTVRIMFQPLWTLARVAHNMPAVRVLHSASTGYAGYLGALLHDARGVPLVLSEHGIYTKERQIDLLKSEWIRDNRNIFQRDPTELSYFRQMWIRLFEWLGRYCYAAANPIIALYETNRLRQVHDGADPARTFNIPNGIQLSRFSPMRAKRPAQVPPVLCLIGRVVPIKDVKTFIRAMRRVVNQVPDAEGWIAGPTDEDQAYAQECQNLVRSLGLENHVKFLGFQKVEDLMPRIGLVVLSSISEALPLVILEGYAAGVPTISTDVGSCRQLIEGLSEEDRALGPSGSVVGIADPQALADAAIALLADPEAWQRASTAAIARVERYYTDTMMFESYRQVYRKALQGSASATATETH